MHEILFCENCKKPIEIKDSKYKRKFCSVTCIADNKKKKLLEYWLKTGIPNTFTGGKNGNTLKSHYIRDYLLKEQNNCCAICKCSNIWNNKVLNFILDHIDGDCNHNSRENLRLICPNCDSQTDTYKGKNLGKGRRSKGYKTY
jgi:hypothetical protein